mgnify:CR=1|jgi:hypothetical protein
MKNKYKYYIQFNQQVRKKNAEKSGRVKSEPVSAGQMNPCMRNLIHIQEYF